MTNVTNRAIGAQDRFRMEDITEPLSTARYEEFESMKRPEEDFRDMSIAELSYWRLRIQGEADEIRRQMKAAERAHDARRRKVNEEWYGGAGRAYRVKTEQVQQIQRLLGLYHRKARREHATTKAQKFITVARKKLAPDLFEEIREEAWR